MASLDAIEAQLKKKLEDTENLEERREIRKQLRELRNKKFEEEIKKVTATDYRPGRDRDRSALSNGVESSIGSIGKKESVNKEDEEDVYGINHLETEEDLQALLNETPFTETDKRKKIRARIREIRNHKLGLGEPVVIKRATRETRTLSVDTEKDEGNKFSSVQPENNKSDSLERESSYSRSSYRNRYTDNDGSADTGRSRISRNTEDTESSYRSSRTRKYEAENRESEYSAGKNELRMKQRDEVLDSNEVNDRNEVTSGTKGVEVVEEVDSTVDQEEVLKDDVEVNGYGADKDANVNDDTDYQIEKESPIGRNERSSSNAESVPEKEDISEVSNDRVEDEEDVDDVEDAESRSDEEEEMEDVEPEAENHSNVEDDDKYENQFEDSVEKEVDREDEKNTKRDRGDSTEEEERYSDEEETVEEKRDDLDEEDYSDAEEDAYQEEDELEEEKEEVEEEEEGRIQESERNEGRVQQDYSDDYSEGYSDQTQTDEGSSVSGRRLDDDQNLDDYEFEKPATHRARSGSGYAKKVEEAFKHKEPAIAEGKNFKELLKKSDKSPATMQPGSGKKGAEQVDFRTVLRSSDKPKKFGEKQVSSAEQVDFRNLLQKKVKTKTLADKDLNVEQVDFRTVLKAGAPEKKETTTTTTTTTPQRKISATAEQVDFRNVLKKQPSLKSRKMSVDDKNEMIKTLRASKEPTNKILTESSAAKPGRPSLDSLRQGGAVTKAKVELSKTHTDDNDNENGKVERKASRPSLDALKESGELGKTEDKKEKFEGKNKKTPKPAPPKPMAKKKLNSNMEETIENEIIEEPETINEVESQPDIVTEVEKDVTVEDKVSSIKEVKEKSTKTSNNESSDRPRSRRRKEDESLKEPTRSERRASQESDDKRGSLKSGDKRARHRRLRQDQNEAVKEVPKKTDDDVDKVDGEIDVAEAKSKSSSIERVAVVQSTAARPTVQVILSTKSSGEKDKQEDSDDESIGMRRNRRRLLRKSSVDEKDSGRVDVRTISSKGAAIEVTKDRKDKRGSSTGSSNADEADGKPTRSVSRTEISTSSKTVIQNDKESAVAEDPSKARKAKMANLDARIAERRRQRAIENKEKQQKIRNSRKAFKDQLDSNAPTTNGSASPSVQRANSNMTKLLHWCQRMTDGYPNVSVTNFTTSWSDGLAFCALLHNFVPDKVPFGELSAKRSRENFETAFGAAAEEGVPELLEVDDMVRMECPDPKSVITYIHAIYQVFVTDRR